MKAIIIGATSGIGRELSKTLSQNGYEVGICGRRENLLNSLEKETSGKCYKAVIDLQKLDDAQQKFSDLLAQMKNVDLIVFSSGTGFLENTIEKDIETIDVNVKAFTAFTHLSYEHFKKHKQGHFVGISSIGAVRGGPASCYNATKAYMSNFLEGLSCRFKHISENLYVTDIRPGFVDTQMAKGEGHFWKASPQKAAIQIFDAIKKKKRIAYITKRWVFIAAVLKLTPFRLYKKLIPKPSSHIKL